MEIYADVILLINFIMNSFILWATAKLSRQKILYLRLFAGGLIMALMYVLAMIILPFNTVISLLYSAAMLSVGIYAAFSPQNIKAFFRLVFVGFVCSLILGGLGMMLFDRLANLSLLIVCVLGAYILIKLGIRLVENVTIKKQMLLPVTIYIGDEKHTLQALVDTGHTLCDPLSDAPVIIAEFESIKELLPGEMRLMFYERQENDLSGLLTASSDNRFHERIRMIPFASLGLANGMLVGFRPDWVVLSSESKNETRKDVVIGIYNRKLSGDGRYQGLISPELVA